FEEPRVPIAALSMQARWRVQGERIDVDVEQLTLDNADAAGSFKAHWRTAEGEARFPGLIDLSGSLSRANGTRVHRYLPLVIPAEARHYVRDAIVKGQAHDVAVRLKGDLRDVPYEKGPAAGEFHIGGPVTGVTMAYVPASIQPSEQPPWPALTDLTGELVFDRAGMQVRNAQGNVQSHPGWQFTRVQASIDDFTHARVVVNGEGRGALAAALGIVRQSPVASFTQHALDHASAGGNAALQLKLDLPVTQIEQSKVEGRVTLQGNEVRMTPESPLLTQAQGVIGFTESGFAVPDVRLRLLGGETHLSGGTQSSAGGAPAVALRASGSVSAEALRQMSGWDIVPAIARQASGSAAYVALIGFHDAAPEVQVSSDLRGMALDLPAPLAKSAAAAWPLRFEWRTQAAPKSGAATRLRLSLADQLALDYELDTAASPVRVLRGALGIGTQATAGLTLPARDVQARLQLPRLHVSDWQAVGERLLSGAATSGSMSGFWPNLWSLRTDELLLDERTLHQVTASGTQQNGLWRAEVQARELEGRIEYSPGAGGAPGKVQARLTRLSIPANSSDEPAAAGKPAAGKPAPAAHMPALDIVAEEFELRGKKLGRLEVQAVNRERAPAQADAPAVHEWQLSRLALHMPEADFSASGQWTAPATPRAPQDARRTALDFKLDIQDGGALLARLGMPDVLARGKGQLDGSIGWNGTPYSPHYPSMDGQLHLDVGAGQFLKAEPGIAKLLGVLSLQALPRRLTLDFRDVFSTGFAFDFVRGDIAVQHGVAVTHNLQMKGVNAAVLMEGSADLDKETQDLHVVVVPEIDAGTAALAAAVINPAVGIGAFIAQLVLKRPLIKAATREFHIGGRWVDPQVTPLHANAQTKAASATLETGERP
ncbi:MAG: TIGR02099 family protein, partial [Burkholderiaceae bacterium]|nr:TIGR02099 family protein [Burkholderiaceae bacterium]